MRKLLLALALGTLTVPAHAETLISLHMGVTPPVAHTPAIAGLLVTSVFVLAGVIAFRLVKR